MAVFYVDSAELKEKVRDIRAGDEVFLSGTVYTARDAAHKRIKELIENKKPLPFDMNGAVIYYAGPTPERPGAVIGSCGPTTSSRMDEYVPLFYENGLLATIGKGPRSKEAVNALKEHKGIYLCAIGGAGALAAMSVKKMEVIAFEDLGCESVKKLTVENFPLICAVDCGGNSIFQ
ncbi:MAG: FumA C-terminus/TtdB family hydratase beta subunit [Clostridiales bacterium]|nr:FumA C-terminus/TtdB family hydratase beta subunit [Clostridiales bacterium]